MCIRDRFVRRPGGGAPPALALELDIVNTTGEATVHSVALQMNRSMFGLAPLKPLVRLPRALAAAGERAHPQAVAQGQGAACRMRACQ